MQKRTPEMIAEIIKSSRLARGLTQKELAEQTHISVRSIQRIENASLMPRSYTLKTIAAVLDIPFAELVTDEEGDETGKHVKTPGNVVVRKIILSVFIPAILVLAAVAFISQSAKFPETNFEAFVFWAFVSMVVATVLYFIWQPPKPNK